MQIVIYKQSVWLDYSNNSISRIQLMAELQIRVNVGRSTSFHCMNSNLLNGAQW